MQDIQLKPFGDLLRTLRKQKRITQRQLATKLGVHYNTIWAWEHGDYLPDTKGMVLELAKQLNLRESETFQMLEASLTALALYWHVPYHRNPFFTGREEILQQLHTVLQQERTSIVSCATTLSGLGGVGKTQTAIEYAYRYLQSYSAIFWIEAENVESVTSSFLAIAQVLKLPERQEQDKAVAAVIGWLNSHTDWLLIVDNVEDVEMVKHSLPTTHRGAFLFTTRLQALQGLAPNMEMMPFSYEEGTLFLLRRARLLKNDENLERVASDTYKTANAIIQEVDGLPLALDQAGAYIEETRCSLSEFFHLFQTYFVYLLRERDERFLHPLSVERTFVLSFEQIKQQDHVAAELLTLCCFLAPDPIPEELLMKGTPSPTSHIQPIVSDPLAFNNALKKLLSYSLIHRHSQSKRIKIHRLVQTILKERLPEEDQHIWAQHALYIVNEAFFLEQNRVNIGQWPTCEQLLPHAFFVVSQVEQWKLFSPELSSLLTKMAIYLFQRARFEDAERLYLRARAVQEQILATDDPELASTLTGLGNTYQQLGKYQTSEHCYQQALSLLEKRLGPEHLQLTFPLQGLAFLLFEMARYQEAEVLYRHTLHIREHSLPPDHPDVAETLNGLAGFCEHQARYEEASLLYQRALHIRERAFGPEHPEVSESLNDLAVLYYHQSRYQEAETLYLRALQINEQRGSDHPDVGATLNNLAHLYHRQGWYDQAEPLYLRALRIRENAFGPEHPYTAFFMHHLASLYREQKRYEEAKMLSLRSLNIYEQTLKPGHPVVATPLSNLALLYEEQGHYEQAERFALRALQIYEQSMQADHPDVAASLHQVANIYVKQKRYEEANVLYQRALSIRVRVLGVDHPDTAALLNSVATLYVLQYKYTEAESLYIQALETLQPSLSSDHPTVISSLQSLTNLRMKLNMDQE